MSNNLDFIPDGKDTGGYGNGGYQDWIPDPKAEEKKIDKKKEEQKKQS